MLLVLLLGLGAVQGLAGLPPDLDEQLRNAPRMSCSDCLRARGEFNNIPADLREDLLVFLVEQQEGVSAAAPYDRGQFVRRCQEDRECGGGRLSRTRDRLKLYRSSLRDNGTYDARWACRWEGYC